MKSPPTGAPQATRARATRAGAGRTGQLARILAILGVNVALVVAAFILSGGRAPKLDAETLAVGLLPISAATGLMLACRRLDLSLYALFALAAALRADPHVFGGSPLARLGAVAAVCAGVGVASAFLTWYGRIASGLWTVLLCVPLWLVAMATKPALFASGGWPMPAAVAASLALLAVGAALLGATGLVVPPSRPPILPAGPRTFTGLVAAWALAAAAVALAAASDEAKHHTQDVLLVCPQALAAAALGGGFILRGRWGAAAAVVLTSIGHLAWMFACNVPLGGGLLGTLAPAVAPLAAIPLYLIIDAAIRRRTGQSAPTGLLA